MTDQHINHFFYETNFNRHPKLNFFRDGIGHGIHGRLYLAKFSAKTYILQGYGIFFEENTGQSTFKRVYLSSDGTTQKLSNYDIR